MPCFLIFALAGFVIVLEVTSNYNLIVLKISFAMALKLNTKFLYQERMTEVEKEGADLKQQIPRLNRSNWNMEFIFGESRFI